LRILAFDLASFASISDRITLQFAAAKMDLALTYDVESMSDDKLLQQEKELYEFWVRYTTKSVCGSTFGTFGALATLGMSLFITGPIVSSHIYWANYYGSQLARCTAEVKRRGLESLETSYGAITAGIVTTIAVGAACAVIPFADGAQEAAVAAAKYAAGPLENGIEMVAEAASIHVQAVADGADRVAEGVIEAAQVIHPGPGVETLHESLSAVPLDSVEQLTLEQIAQSAQDIAGMLPEIVEVSIMTAGSHAIFIGCESLVGVEITRQSKKDMVKYVKLRRENLDDESSRKLVEDIFDEPVKFVTQFKDLSDAELQQKESKLMTAVSRRLASLGWTTGKIAITLQGNPFALLVQARSTFLLHCELRECRIEANERNLPSQYTQKLYDAAKGGILGAAKELAQLLAQRGFKWYSEAQPTP
jgi:hypothetical protein